MDEKRFTSYRETRLFDSFRKSFIKNTPETTRVDFHGTVKIHGTNISIVFTPSQSWQLHSRNRILSSKYDHYSVYDTFSKLPLHVLLTQVLAISPQKDWNEIVIVGEWAGEGINKGVGVCSLDKFYTIFNIRIDKKWQDMRVFKTVSLPDHRIYNVYSFPTFQVTVDFSDLMDVERVDKYMSSLVEEVDRKCPVAHALGVDGPGEGIVFTYYPPEPCERLRNFKVKGRTHQIVQRDKLDNIPPGKVNAINAFVEYSITEARLDQGIAYLEEMHIEIVPKSTGKYIGWIVRDVLKEEKDTLEELGLNEKDVKTALTDSAREGWKVRLKTAQRTDLYA